jgi:hypothetical protein
MMMAAHAAETRVKNSIRAMEIPQTTIRNKASIMGDCIGNNVQPRRAGIAGASLFDDLSV